MRVAAVLFVLLTSSAAMAADYWVDPVRGDDSNPGTSTDPWRTIVHSGEVAVAGDVVHAGPGVYVSSAPFGAPVWIYGWQLIGAGAGRSILEDHGVKIIGGGGRLEGFTLRSPAGYGELQIRPVTKQRPPEPTVIRNCIFERIPVSFVYYVEFGADPNLQFTVEECLFLAPYVHAVEVGPIYDRSAQSLPASFRATVRNVTVIGGTGLFRHWASRDCGPLMGYWEADVELVNNTVIGATGDAISLQSQQCGALKSVVISNNIITASAGFAIAEVPGLSAPWPSFPDEVANNLFDGCAKGVYSDIETGVKLTAAELNTMTNAAGNMDASPIFIDPAANDYRLAAGSPGIDAALPVRAPTVDFERDPRPLDGDGDTLAVADIGADEYNPGVALLRNTDVSDIDPLTPARDIVLPLNSPRDDFLAILPAGGLEDAGILADRNRPLVFYRLLRPGNDLLITRTSEVKLHY